MSINGRTLCRLHRHGLPCPEPLVLRDHILIMSFIGENELPAPQLYMAKMSSSALQTAYEQTLQVSVDKIKPCSHEQLCRATFWPTHFRRTQPTTGAWNRSHTKTFERVEFYLSTRQKNPAVSIDNFLTWSWPKVAHVNMACSKLVKCL